MNENYLYILWTNADPVTAEKMVLMYGTNAKIHGWWEEITIIIWGSTASLIAENENIRELVAFAIQKGVKFSACKACADQLNVSENLSAMGIEIKYWGEGLTELLKTKSNLLTI
ncbi:DsrE family protein [Fusibacter ferrireducens]|uniref:DsrE family protein n=1 Tax=Fusibacter ferrireducens TaxID=2785058 RepID=A0ABR9ZPH5_9FIRM|nr:DsrE family protein [Fusibacter ferrireducens]MBF4692368.1 DsrE family protein [Fusibacter ferrireducens]